MSAHPLSANLRSHGGRLGRIDGQTQLAEERKKDLFGAGLSSLGASSASGTDMLLTSSTSLLLSSGGLCKSALALSLTFAS